MHNFYAIFLLQFWQHVTSLRIYFLNIVTGYLTLLKISSHELRLIAVLPWGLLVAGMPGSLAVMPDHTHLNLFFFFLSFLYLLVSW